VKQTAISDLSVLFPFLNLNLNLSVQYTGSAWGELKHIRQAVGFLVRVTPIQILIQYIID